ncbi:LOB domain-containing protein 20-like [Rutidosis leptorrhynchoides]|uniref:LOB domain-containing protein 20-like n=1 Tax=Rutidosis leptorrhynchoides TaxID=125765 RepID=UPI003A9A1DB2
MADSSDSRRKGTGVGKRVSGSFDAAASDSGSIPNPPCGACKFLRRKCVNGCIFAPYFGSDQGAARFAAVHKVFGASNVSKLLTHIPVNRRQHAVVTISYEAQARLSDPVYGCVSTVLALQQQVAALQTELAIVQNQLISNKLLVANALQSSQQVDPMHHLSLLQPAYSNASSASNNNMLNMNSYDSGLNNLADDHHSATLSHQSFNPLQLCQPCNDDEDDDEEESGDPLAFANQMLQSR